MLHYGTEEDLRLMIIDGGPKAVYIPHLRGRIEQIRQVREIPANQPLDVEMLMVSHVDDDHIRGILDLTKELRASIEKHQSQLAKINYFWHNSFENVIGEVPPKLTAEFTNKFGAASVDGDPPEFPPELTLDFEEDDKDEETIVWSFKALASIKQGQQLRTDADRLEIELNHEFKKGDGSPGLIMARENSGPIEMGNDLSFTVVGPMEPELKKLWEEQQKWLIDLQKEGKTAEDVLVAYVDKSPPNLSSIVVLAEFGGKKILLTGDARGDKVLEGLEFTGVINEGETLNVDILKVPHHGSSNNLDKDFFERIIARHYVFSGNGEHGNPERESLEMLLDARRNANYTVHLTYPLEEIDKARHEEWEKQQKAEKSRQAKALANGKPARIREDWSTDDHSLEAFFDSSRIREQA